MTESTNSLGLSTAALVQMLESGGGSFLAYKKALSGLTDEQAHIIPAGSPHSIAEVLAHIHYWQNWVLSKLGGEDPAIPEHAAGGWPAVADGEWDALVQGFLADTKTCQTMAQDEAKLAESFAWGNHQMTVGFALLDTAMHNGHHLGQITLLRQLIDAWPPEGGAYTW